MRQFNNWLLFVVSFTCRELIVTAQINPPGCGRQLASQSSSRIVGGIDAEKGEFPWQVLLQARGGDPRSFFCGGSVINSKWVVTAAHCVPDAAPEDLSVRLGVVDRLDATEGVTVNIATVISHELYNPQTTDNDIALLELAEAVDFSSQNIRPVCLPTETEDPDANSAVIASGWGRLSEGGLVSGTLQEVEVQVTERSECDDKYGGRITGNMICAAGTNKDSCQGDSGGPLVQKRDNNKFFLEGVVSWGFGCAREAFPGVYTKVRVYKNWIASKIGFTPTPGPAGDDCNNFKMKSALGKCKNGCRICFGQGCDPAGAQAVTVAKGSKKILKKTLKTSKKEAGCKSPCNVCITPTE